MLMFHAQTELGDHIKCGWHSCDQQYKSAEELFNHFNGSHLHYKNFQEHGSTMFECKSCHFQTEELNAMVNHNKTEHDINEITDNIFK